jgi:hypothetical protein
LEPIPHETEIGKRTAVDDHEQFQAHGVRNNITNKGDDGGRIEFIEGQRSKADTGAFEVEPPSAFQRATERDGVSVKACITGHCIHRLVR